MIKLHRGDIMVIIDNFDITIEKKWVLKTIDCYETSPVYEEVSSTYDELVKQIKDIVKPKAVFKFDKRPEDFQFDHIKECSHIVYCALTLGEEISKKSTELFDSGDYLAGMMVDAIADELMHEISSQLYKKIYEEAKKRGFGLTFRIAPGGNILPIHYNTILVKAINGEQSLNLSYTSQFMLNPVKSESFIYGVDEKIPLPVVDNYCLSCNDAYCKRRRNNDSVKIEVTVGSNTIVLNGTKSKSIMENLIANDISITSPCGGKCLCGKCKIQVIKGSTSYNDEQLKFLTKTQLNTGYRLACMAYANEDCSIKIVALKEDDFEILEGYEDTNSRIINNFDIKKISIQPSSVDEQKSMAALINEELQKKYSFTLEALKKLSVFNSEQMKGLNVQEKSKVSVIIHEGTIVDVCETGQEKIYGIGIDIGTTTLALNLIDLLSGSMINSHAMINSQRQYGDDVISRIKYTSDYGVDTLSNCIKNDLTKCIANLCNEAKVSLSNIYSVVIAANSTMIHLLLGLDCESLALSPFTTVTTDLLNIPAYKILKNSLLNCNVTIIPSVSAYVGADIVSGMSKCDFDTLNEVSLLVDIGTNGEIVIGNKGRILCAATAAGPAFEGANIAHGTGSIKGAISSVEIKNGKFQYKTIGNSDPIGICGSGVIDIIACSLKSGIIDETGRFNDDNEEGYIEIAKNINNESIILNQKDIREIQLAKSAIRSGIDVLIKEFGCNYDEIKNVFLAGGFGNKINIQSSIDIGLIPEEFKGKIKFIGNASLGGTVDYLLNKDNMEKIENILKLTKYVELSSYKEFNDLFVENMMF
jgi:uncharacterized 2Fe-2S/4Fe-4S cluster protein (DUF4445 family)